VVRASLHGGDQVDVTIHRARLDRTHEQVDIGIDAGRIVEISPLALPAGRLAIDGHGQMATPPFFEPHFHLDNPLLGAGTNTSGTLREAIEIYGRIKVERDPDELVRLASLAVRESLAHGVLWFRSHVDIDPSVGLRLLHGVRAVKERFAGVVDISIIAFPQLGLARSPETVELMYAAMEAGADLVGGIPHHERDMDDAARQIELLFEIARHAGADLDLHVDESDDPYWQSLGLLAEATIRHGYQGRVNASHICASAAWDSETFARIIGAVRDADINIVTLPLTNLVLQGRGDRPPIRRGVPPLDRLLAAGVNVAVGHDDLANMFYPFGDLNPLYAANVAAHAGHLTTPELIRAAFEMPGYRAARAFRMQAYGIQAGLPANLVLLPVETELDALRLHPSPTLVMREGRVLVRTRTEQTFDQMVPA
jgi:cytosine deaminase